MGYSVGIEGYLVTAIKNLLFECPKKGNIAILSTEDFCVYLQHWRRKYTPLP
jgi:hypothetical protein